MSDLSVKISANTAAASSAFKDMAASSEYLQKKITKLGEDMSNDKADRFIQQQKLAGIAMQAVGKETKGLTKQHAAYQKEIVRLIKSGLDPESEAVQKLQREYDGLTKEIERETAARKMQQNAWKISAGALAGIAAGVGAFVGASIKSAASIEDMTAAFTPMMGSTEKASELVKRLNKEAVTTPFELDNISKSVRRLLPAFGGDMEAAIKAFRMIGDTAGGNSQALETMTIAYSNVQMTGKASMEDLNRIANSGVPIFTELAKSQGKTVAEIRQMTSDGEISADVLTDVFRTMTSEGGLFFEGMETSAFTFSSTMLGIKENISLVAGQIGERFLPYVKEMADKVANAIAGFSEWISQGDNLTRLLDTLTYAIAGVSAGLVAFLVVAKGATVINILTAAFHGLTAAIASNPIGAIAVVVTSILIPGLIALYKNWDTISTYLQQGIANLEYAFKSLASMAKESFIVAINGIKIGFLSLVEIIATKVLGSIQKLLSVLEKIPGVGEAFKAANAVVTGLGGSFINATREARNASAAAIQAARDEQNAAQSALNSKLTAIDMEARARRAALDERKALDEEEAAGTPSAETNGTGIEVPVTVTPANEDQVRAAVGKSEKAVTEEQVKALQERLQLLGDTEAQAKLEQNEQFRTFLESRLEAQIAYDTLNNDMEMMNWEEKVAFLEEQKNYILENTRLTEEEKTALENEYNALRLKAQKEHYSAQGKLMDNYLGATANFFGNLQTISDAMGVKNRGLAIAQKSLMIAQATVQTYMAANAALANGGGVPWGLIPMAATIVAGIANVAKISTTQIPSAETGASFMVPNEGSVDSRLVRVNPGEQIDITPRGQTGGEGVFNFQFLMDGEVFAEVMNKQAVAGNLYKLQLAGNL